MTRTLDLQTSLRGEVDRLGDHLGADDGTARNSRPTRSIGILFGRLSATLIRLRRVVCHVGSAGARAIYSKRSVAHLLTHQSILTAHAGLLRSILRCIVDRRDHCKQGRLERVHCVGIPRLHGRASTCTYRLETVSVGLRGLG